MRRDSLNRPSLFWLVLLLFHVFLLPQVDSLAVDVPPSRFISCPNSHGIADVLICPYIHAHTRLKGLHVYISIATNDIDEAGTLGSSLADDIFTFSLFLTACRMKGMIERRIKKKGLTRRSPTKKNSQ